MSARLQLRGDTLANWLKYDPVLMEREVALIASNPNKPKVYDLKKVGDGTRKFSELPMLGYECLQDIGDSQQFPMSQKATTDVFKGIKDGISAYYFPIIRVPDFANGDWASLNSFLDNIDFSNDKYIGHCKLSISGRNIDLYNYIFSFSNKFGIQVLKGGITISSKGTISSSSVYKILYRKVYEGVCSEWIDYSNENIVQTLGQSDLRALSQKSVTDKMSNTPCLFENSYSDLDIVDTLGNVLVRFSGGGVQTKNFDSRDTLKKEKLSYFNKQDFRAYLDIYKDYNGNYFTNYNFSKNKIEGLITIYISPNGNDDNSGLTPNLPLKTLNKAISLNANTIILTEGTYNAVSNFTNGLGIKNVNVIGIGNVIIDSKGGEPIKIVGNIYIENITFINGNYGSLRTLIEDKASVCTFVNCHFNDSIVDTTSIGSAKSLGGLRAQGGTYFLFRCEASNNGYDGFNYHSAPDGSTNSPHVAEVECYGYYNGRNSSYESDNGSTAHDGSKVLRLNCKYGVCHGGIIADVHTGTVSYNVGCSAFSSIDLGDKREYQANYFCATNAEMHLIDCYSHGSYYDISCFNNGKVITNKAFIRNYSTGGSIKIQ